MCLITTAVLFLGHKTDGLLPSLCLVMVVWSLVAQFSRWHDVLGGMLGCHLTLSLRWHCLMGGMVCQVTWSVRWHGLSGDMVCLVILSVQCQYGLSVDMISQLTWSVR